MKKIALLLSLAVTGFTANAQFTLTGSSYTQNFDGIGSGLPTGWNVYSASSSTSIGSLSSLNTASCYPSYLHSDSICIAEVVVGGFKNFPSADVSSPGDDYCNATPPVYTNRAVGVRQVSPTNASHPNLDSGAAFVFEVANTTGLTAFTLKFQLQSFDTSSPRITEWMVDYGFGTAGGGIPTLFTPATTTTGTWTTGGHTFSNNSCTVNFGSALDNSSVPVYIRVVTLNYSSGSGNRASTGIDDYLLSWTVGGTGVQTVPTQPITSLAVVGQSTSDNVILAYSVEEEGAYTLSIYDLSGRTIHTEIVSAQATGKQSIAVNGLHLTSGMYIAKMSNSNSSSVARIAVQ